MDFSCLKISESVQVWGLAFMQWNTQEITTLKFCLLEVWRFSRRTDQAQQNEHEGSTESPEPAFIGRSERKVSDLQLFFLKLIHLT